MKIPHLRWYFAALLFSATVINYIDRQVLSGVAPVITKELNINAVEYSNNPSSQRPEHRMDGFVEIPADLRFAAGVIHIRPAVVVLPVLAAEIPCRATWFYHG
jgi:hypothetical protein